MIFINYKYVKKLQCLWYNTQTSTSKMEIVNTNYIFYKYCFKWLQNGYGLSLFIDKNMDFND